MEYVIPAVLVMVLVGGFVTFLVLNATKKSGSVAEQGDEGAPGMGQDPTPLGDTAEHAGRQTEGGTTRDDPEEGERRRSDPDAAAHVSRPGEARAKPQPVTSEARQREGEERLEFEGEGEERLEFEGERPRPASERLADRDF